MKDPAASIRRGGLVVGWSALLAATLWFLHSVGHGDLAAPPLGDPAALGSWLDTVGSAHAVVAVVRLVALVLGWYLVLTTIAGSLVRVSGMARLQRATDAVTPAFLRGLLGSAGTISAAGLTLAVSPLLGSGTGPLDSTAAAAAPVREEAAGEPAILERIEPAVLVAVEAEGDHDDALRVAALMATAQPPSGPATWTVETGDHLWHIAEETLADAWGRPVTDAEVASYWLEVIAANRANLVVPDNPDLIYPGQVMELPSPPAVPAG